MVTDVGIVDVTSVVHLRLVDALELRHGTANADSSLTVAVVGRAAITEEQGRDDIKLRNAAAQPLHILVVHRPHTSLAETLICLGGGLCPHHSRVGGKAREVLLQQFLQSLTATHQCHEHEHTPEHAEARQERAALVARQGVEHLAITVYIYSHNLFCS